ncbi:hypothetical protein AVDCRST_MAG81-5158 [uncultured Synechococcales cyanobacterium]|uniref:Serine aminopeptidase S33 domain-containing protein n=1 Tax=uncultured Synechococcales cyanobacterium TaxID=1936017 RepID=A0A6J4VX91_9CYAN|nr:hypothetical protein AVDCRST_MAG81-5158 [uncultured Synechococcales cyanobacterium]
MLRNQPFFLNGGEQACLLLHGLGSGVYEMQLLGQYLHQQGLTVQAIHYPGHDQPVSKMPASTWPQWYGHVLETYQALAKDYTSVAVIGFSTGCLLSLHLAAAHPVEKLVLLCPYLALRREWYYPLPVEAYLFSLGWLIQEVPRLRLPIQDPVMRAAAEKVEFFRTFNLAAVRSAIELIDRVKDEITRVSAPTLIIQARKDTIVDPAGAEWLRQNLTSSVELSWLEHSDHIIPLDLERQQVFTQVGRFLRSPSSRLKAQRSLGD